MEDIPEFLGANLDTREVTQQARDFMREEFASSPNVEWKEKNNFRRFSKRNQAYSSSCGAQSGAKILEINEKNETNDDVVFSALAIYRNRSNFPNGGMTIHDVLKNIASDYTAYKEKSLRSMNMSEQEMNTANIDMNESDKKMSLKYKAQGFEFIRDITIDKIAEVIQSGKGVLLMLYFSKVQGVNEYWKYEPNILIEKLDLYDNETTSRHFVVAVDFTMINGKKYLVIEDSAGNNTAKNGQRILSEDFISKRCYGAGYSIDKKNSDIERPKYKFNKILKFGMTKNKDVVALQKILQYEKLLPTHVNGKELELGNYFGQTSYAVLQFQKKYNIASLEELTALRGMTCGKKTIAKLNELYS